MKLNCYLAIFLFINLLDLTGSESIEMVAIPNGCFTRGTSHEDNNPLEIVCLPKFRMSKYEINYGLFIQYARVIDPKATWNGFSRLYEVNQSTQDLDFKIPDDWPIWHVDYFDAIMFCNWLSEKDGFKPVYSLKPIKSSLGYGDFEVYWDQSANGYRLPTEAEWEYAARAGGLDEKVMSDNPEVLNKIAWWEENSGKTLHAIGQLEPNLWGLFDIIGNVSEWCWDYYQKDYYLNSPKYNPLGPEIGEDPMAEREPERSRIARGGSISTSREWAWDIAAGREPIHPGYKGLVGIRLVRSAE